MADIIEFKDFGRNKNTIAFGGYAPPITSRTDMVDLQLTEHQKKKYGYPPNQPAMIYGRTAYDPVVISVPLYDEETYKLFDQYMEDLYEAVHLQLWDTTFKFDAAIKRTSHIDSLVGCWLQMVDRDDKEITLKLVFDLWNKIDNQLLLNLG